MIVVKLNEKQLAYIASLRVQNACQGDTPAPHEIFSVSKCQETTLPAIAEPIEVYLHARSQEPSDERAKQGMNKARQATRQKPSETGNKTRAKREREQCRSPGAKQDKQQSKS